MSWDEYRLLQDKVDRIGDFHFRVKGWLVTLVTGAVVGGFATGIPPWGYLLTLVLIFSFWLVDWRQTKIEDRYLERLDELELVLSATSTFRVFQVRPSPKHLRQKNPIRAPHSPMHSISMIGQRYGTFQKSLIEHVDGIFYWLQVGLVICISIVAFVSAPRRPQQITVSSPVQLAPLQVAPVQIEPIRAAATVALVSADGGSPTMEVSLPPELGTTNGGRHFSDGGR